VNWIGKLIVGVCCLVALGLGSAYIAYGYLQSWADTPLPGAEQTIFHVTSGDTLANVAVELTRQSRLDHQHQRLLQLLGRIEGVATQIQVGEYALETGATPRGLLKKIVVGDVVQHAFRIQEGETVAQMLQRIRAHEQIRHTLQATSPNALKLELGLEAPFAEGVFFPDTYLFAAGDTDRALLVRAYQAMDRELTRAWEARSWAVLSPEQSTGGNDGDDKAPAVGTHAADLKDRFELLILASIIEKETGRAEDRSQISQVFHKRLRDRMLLQTDPTVIYAAGASYAGDITREHLKLDSPFNTYKYRGLPPTPIALPSRASLRAAANPASGDYVYFVARGDGTSQFSRTLSEHNAAVRKYLLSQ